MFVRIEPTSVLTIAPGFQQRGRGGPAPQAPATDWKSWEGFAIAVDNAFALPTAADSHLPDSQPDSIVSIIW